MYTLTIKNMLILRNCAQILNHVHNDVQVYPKKCNPVDLFKIQT